MWGGGGGRGVGLGVVGGEVGGGRAIIDPRSELFITLLSSREGELAIGRFWEMIPIQDIYKII